MAHSFFPGQRWMSQTEPELGLGLVIEQEGRQVVLSFPASGETRRYMTASAPLRRARFRVGDALRSDGGESFTVAVVREHDGVLTYEGDGVCITEAHLDARISGDSPEERIRLGQWDTAAEYELRQDLWRFRERWAHSVARGLMGGRIQLLPHQLYIAREVIERQHPRVLLADEPGLGKTIESILILHHALAVGRVKRVLVLVPESLQHQWFVELLRRFQLVFRIIDDEYCDAFDAHNEGENPFEDEAFVLCSLSWLVRSPERTAQAVAAQWDMLVVDEVHHIGGESAAYQLLFHLSQKTPSLLLLTATPEQLGAQSHFARLKLLDPQRYGDYDAYMRQHDHYQALADLAAKLLDVGRPFTLAKPERTYWQNHDPQLLQMLEGVSEEGLHERQHTMINLLDRFGPGRVIFRNTRGAVEGFPEREVALYPLAAGDGEEASLSTGVVGSVPSSERHEDPRFPWLLTWLRENGQAKALLLCRTRSLVEELERYLKGASFTSFAIFHEGLTLIQRDRNAAWFAEPEGARLLLSSEIGGEGRNFQTAQHLILFDLPDDPELLEQRIGRLDRIGQAPRIFIHVPYAQHTFHEVLARWYHEGLGILEAAKPGGNLILEAFAPELEAMRLEGWDGARLDALLERSKGMQEELRETEERGRNRLLEWGSFEPESVLQLMEEIRSFEADESLWELTYRLFDALGVDVDRLTLDTWLLKPGPRLHPAFPWLKGDRRAASFSRERAMQRDTTIFLSPDHPMVSESMELWLGSQQGSASVVAGSAANPEIRVAATFILEAVSPPALRVDRFLPPTPVTIILNQREELVRVPEEVAWQELPPSLIEHKPQLVEELIPGLLSSARVRAANAMVSLRAASLERALSHYRDERERLEYLSSVNAEISPEELKAMVAEAEAVTSAIESARLRLDSLQLQILGLL